MHLPYQWNKEENESSIRVENSTLIYNVKNIFKQTKNRMDFHSLIKRMLIKPTGAIPVTDGRLNAPMRTGQGYMLSCSSHQAAKTE